MNTSSFKASTHLNLNTNYLTGFRGYAVLIIIIIHSGGAGLRELGFNNLVDSFRMGVVIFFVLSSYTLSLSISKKWTGYFEYFMKRYFRIAPLYYLAIIIGGLLGGAQYYLNIFNTENGILSYLSHALFFNVFIPKYQNSILGLEWTIPIEMIYYCLIPSLFFISKKKPILFYIIVFAALLFNLFFSNYFYSILFNPTNHYSVLTHWNPLSYLYTFLLGVLAFHLKERNKNKKTDLILFLSSSVLLFIYFAFFNITILGTSNLFFITLISSRSESSFRKIFLENKTIFFIGKISYSMYLIHLMFIPFIQRFSSNNTLVFVMVLTCTIVSGALLYYIIEEPIIKFIKNRLNEVR